MSRQAFTRRYWSTLTGDRRQHGLGGAGNRQGASWIHVLAALLGLVDHDGLARQETGPSGGGRDAAAGAGRPAAPSGRGQAVGRRS